MPSLDDDLERLRSALSSPDIIEVGLSEVAARYSAACREMNQRLRKCDELLKKGLISECIRQAQLSPTLLDQFALLDMPERSDWISLAQKHDLPIPPPLQTKLAVDLNQAFAEAESMYDCLARHRVLALARAPIRRRLHVMWRLAKLDPLNPVWMKDLRVFERVRIREIDQEINGADREKDPEQVEVLYQEITHSGWTEPPPSLLVNRVKAIRNKYASHEAMTALATVEQELTDAVTAADKDRAKILCEKAKRLLKIAGLSQHRAIPERLALAFDWVEKHYEREARQEEWREACERLNTALVAIKPYADVARLKNQVLAFGMGVPEELERRVDQRYHQYRRRRVLLWLVMLAVAPLPVCVIAVPLLYRHYLADSPRQKDVRIVEVKDSPPPKKLDDNTALKQEVRSILQASCAKCHGEPKKGKGGLNTVLDHSYLTINVAKEPKGKKYLVPNRPEESAIWLRIVAANELDPMPPSNQKRQLTDAEKSKVKSWIAQGAFPLE